MAQSDGKSRIELTLGGKAVTINVKAGEEALYRYAAQFVELRADAYKDLIKLYGERTGLSMMALEFLIDKLRLQNAVNESQLANKVNDVLTRIDDALQD